LYRSINNTRYKITCINENFNPSCMFSPLRLFLT
jgi:hypothetical protein